MQASLRVLLEILSGGTDPDVDLDSSRDTPLVFNDLVTKFDTTVTVGPSAADQAFVVAADVCAIVVLSDEPITIKLDTGETAMVGRLLVVGGSDNGDAAFPAGSLLFTGNGTAQAIVRVVGLGKVT